MNTNLITQILLSMFSHPKYGEVENPSYKSLEECFESWNEDDGEIGYGVATELRKLDRNTLLTFLNDFMTEGYEYNHKFTPPYVWKTCFGNYYKYLDYESLSNDELVYFILESENYGILRNASIWEILPKLPEDSSDEI